VGTRCRTDRQTHNSNLPADYLDNALCLIFGDFFIPVSSKYTYYDGDCGSTVVKLLCYKSGRSLVRFKIVSLEFFIDI